MGDVIERPEELMDAIRAAPERHVLYVQRQRELAERSLGDLSADAAKRAADDIVRFLREGRVGL